MQLPRIAFSPLMSFECGAQILRNQCREGRKRTDIRNRALSRRSQHRIDISSPGEREVNHPYSERHQFLLQRFLTCSLSSEVLPLKMTKMLKLDPVFSCAFPERPYVRPHHAPPEASANTERSGYAVSSARLLGPCAVAVTNRLRLRCHKIAPHST